jgi:uncharacterized protein (DUF1778 family)
MHVSGTGRNVWTMPIHPCIFIVYTFWIEAMANTTKAERAASTINLRVDKQRRALIDQAAQRLGKNRSEFMLDVACREATSVLLDQRVFLLDDKAYRRFTELLDKPPADNPRLRRLMATKAPWER